MPDSAPLRKRDHLADAALAGTQRLRPLLELVERIRPHVGTNSVFSSRREKIREQLALVQEQLRAEQPRHQALREALREAFRQLSEFVREEAHEVSRDEVKESGKRFVVATLKNAPQLLAAAKQAGLLS